MRRLADGLTILVAIAALYVFAQRVLPPGSAGGDDDEEPAPAEVERRLIGLRPGPIPLVAEERDGVRELRFLAGRKHLLLLFRSDCPSCRATREAWMRLIPFVEGEVWALTPEPVHVRFDLPGARVGHLASLEAFTRELPTTFVPTTIVIGGEGRVEEAHIGALDVDRVEEIIRRLDRSSGSSR